MRSFIAVELPKEITSVLAELQQEFKKTGADVRWVKPENIHLTLKFLGNIKEEHVSNIIKIMKRICHKYTVFNLEISGMSVFPNMKSPRVLWVGIKGNGLFKGLQHEIDNGMASLGFKPEGREFVPHLTLGRFRSFQRKETLLDKIELYKNNKFGSIDVKSVNLMRSDLTPAGAEYSRIAEILFGKTST